MVAPPASPMEGRDNSGVNEHNMSFLLKTDLLSNNSAALQAETKPLSKLQNPT